MKFDVKHLGQVFTPLNLVLKTLSLKRNNGNVLEPSCGDGSFLKFLENYVAIEIDESKCPKTALNIDFFNYDTNNKFDTVIGNPPYVKYKDIQQTVKNNINYKLFDKRSNLYFFFIYKSILHLKENGELIFIVPKDFFNSTSSSNLNKFIYDNGTITDIIYLKPDVFKNFNVDTIIFRFEKSNFSRKTNNELNFILNEGQLLFLKNDFTIKFSDLFYVKVGAVSGCDEVFESENGNCSLVYSKTYKNNLTKKVFYNIYDIKLEKHKDTLLNRKIKKFNEENWFKWGRSCYISDKIRIYVNYKTRHKTPFFYNECKMYDGSILGIFPKFKIKEEEIENLIKDLNNVNWEELGFYINGRYIFKPNSLYNSLLPEHFSKYLISS